MATRLKPTRINVDNTPRVGDGATYQDDNKFKWSEGGGDMSYVDFEWHTLTGDSVIIEDISNNITPTSDFTISAGTVKPGIEYVLRVNTGNTPYTMTLGTGVTNPNSYKTELKPNTVNQFKFIATSTNQLELEGVDSAVVSEINWGEIDGTLSDQTDLQNALDQKLDKVTSTATNPRAYVVNADGSQATLPITDSATSGAIVRRNGTQITVPATPSANTDAASKKYVDDQVSAATAGAVSDTAYGTSWDGVTGIAPSKNAIYDKINSMDTTIAEKQDTLIPGSNISINGNTISATDTTYTAGDNVQISSSNVISATDTTYTAGEGIEILNGDDYSAVRGPAPSGYHVPLDTERQAVYDIWIALGGGSSDGTNFGIALKLPFAGRRDYSSADVEDNGTYGYYWSSSRCDASSAYSLDFDSTTLNPQNTNDRTYGFSVRCFKNSPAIPNSSWTKLYGASIESGGIFWSSTDGLISLSSDGQTWITIADKNLGATTVWNSGDTLSEANCGKYYQWGNNYGFPRTGSVTTSGTQVDASNYGPGNYYSSSTFITRSESPYRWDSTDNGNLRGGETGVVTLNNTITNTGVLSVNGQTGDVVLSAGDVLVSSQPNNILTSGMKIWAGTEADYGNLGTRDSNTLYLTIE